MSRIGRKPIAKAENIEVKIETGNTVTVKGPKGQLTKKIPECLDIQVEKDRLVVLCPSDNREHRSLYGLGRTLLANMIDGVSKGFSKNLELVGVGYRAIKQGNTLVLNVGYSQPVHFEPQEDIEIEVPAPTKITIKGIDKEAVGDTAARIRSIRPPEPYKGKGIKYENEYIRRKAGKTVG
ncbi:MAG: 50S ribosomal protein L6 [Firmicutes bacterium]|nr:50S ribosomal protein L6 [Bacillota bacterium]